MMRVSIIGAGPGDERFLTLEAHRRITGADVVIATARLAGALSRLTPNIRSASLAQIPDAVSAASEQGGRDVVILVSGDSGFYSLGKSLPGLLREKTGRSDLEIDFVSGISSLQCLSAALGVPHDDTKTLSLHGREGSVVPYVCYRPKVFALTGGSVKAHDVIRELVRCGLENVHIAVGADLASPSERLTTGLARDLAAETFPDLACLLIINENCRNPHEHLPDSAFIRGKTPMTKNAVRTLALASLDVQPTDTVFDIGAGTGSVSIALARRAFEGSVFALERDDDALDLMARNRQALGAFNVTIVKTQAPEGLDALPMPNKAFIGGSGGKLPEIIRTLFFRNPDLKVAVTAITLESLHTATTALQDQGHQPHIVCINAALSHPAGSCHLMKAENPVYIISN